MKRLFEIQTLSECSKPNLKNYVRLREKTKTMDPVAVILGIGGLIPSLFPNLFGAERLTMDHLNRLFPGSGYYTMQYKNYLLQRIRYLKDVERDLHMYTGQFIESKPEICNGGTGQTCWQNFYKILQQEQYSGGTQPVGNVLGAGFDFQTLLLVGGGALLLLALTKKKRSKK